MASRLQDIILRSTRALQPLATAVAAGTLYFVTDELVTERSDGAAWQSYSGFSSGATTGGGVGVPGRDGEDGDFWPVVLPVPPRFASFGIVIDGGGVAITTGLKGDLFIPFACTITSVTMLADQSGSIVIDVWKDTYANYPPTVADTITASAKPTISTATKSQDLTLTGWTISCSPGDTLRFNVDSITTVTRVTLSLKVTIA